MDKKVIGIGMSGGVDSSAAAYLLKSQGYDVIGITMHLIDNQKSIDSINDAKRVCEELGIKHVVLDLRDKFKSIVIRTLLIHIKVVLLLILVVYAISILNLDYFMRKQ